MKASWLRTILTNAALMLGALLVAFAIGEFVVRALYKDQTTLFPRYHTDYQYGKYRLRGIRSNSDFVHTSVDGSWRFKTNSRGFRNAAEFDHNKPKGVVRVLSLGDSQTQGYEVHQDQTFSAVLERYLRRGGKKAEVINAGVSGFSTAEALLFLENEGIKYSPDAVVLGFYRNDFEDNVKSGLFKLGERAELVQGKLEHVPGVGIQNILYSISPVRWLSENSYFYSMLFNNVWAYFKVALARQAKSEAGSLTGSASTRSDALEYAVATRTGHSAYEISLAAALIQRMQKFCDSHGAKLIVVDIPARSGPHGFKSSVPQAMREMMSAAHVDFIDSVDYLAGADGAVATHVAHGAWHISEFTHAHIGLSVGKHLQAGRIGNPPPKRD